KATYDATDVIWPASDAWSVHTRDSIRSALSEVSVRAGYEILNAGCGGNDYGIPHLGACTHLDISPMQTPYLARAVVGDVERLPFPDGIFDLVICVGAVINYCEPFDAIPELVRVLRVGGTLLLDFETTTTAEVLFSRHWGRRVSVIERLFADRPDKTF